MKEFYKSNAKLLLTGEYAVLDGAKALALPLKRTQTLEIEETEGGFLNWTSLDEKGMEWFRARFLFNQGDFKPLLDIEQQKDAETRNTAERLQQIFRYAYSINPSKFEEYKGYNILTGLNFNRKWGLGTSSTLINNLAQWLNIDAFQLQENTFGGSGYDIAAAQNDFPITYQRTRNAPAVFTSDFDPSFHEQLFFVYLNRKQNSREAIAHYRNQPEEKRKGLIEKISGITEQVIASDNFEEFRLLLEAHEALISKAINLKKIKSVLFPDYSGTIKSLGGWGGDFILVTGEEKDKEYFRSKGYMDIFNYRDLVA